MDLCLTTQHHNRQSSLIDYISSCQHISPPPPPTAFCPSWVSESLVQCVYMILSDRIEDFLQCNTSILIRCQWYFHIYYKKIWGTIKDAKKIIPIYVNIFLYLQFSPTQVKSITYILLQPSTTSEDLVNSFPPPYHIHEG